MRTSYGVVWRVGESALGRGKLELLPRGLRLDGVADSEPAELTIPYDDLAGVRIGREASERLGGGPSIVLDRRGAPQVRIGTLTQPSLVSEIVERLSALQLGAEAVRRTAVVVPIAPASYAAVRGLLETGPPFDPQALPGLDRHEVLLTEHEVIFLFESQAGGETVDALLAAPGLWEAAAAWSEHLAGPPRLAGEVYSWRRFGVRIEPTLLPPGLRG